MRITTLAAGLAIMMLLVGCGKEPPTAPSASQPVELLLYCGAGLRPVADELIRVFSSTHNVKIVTDYAGSEVLLAKMRLVGQGDLYLPGDRSYVEQAVQANMILSQTPVCYFVPTILVQKGNPKNIQSLHDLTRPGLKIGLGDPRACAIGKVTRQLFDKNHVSWQDIERNMAFQSLTVNELGLQIQTKALDAVVVWDAIAQYYPNDGTEVALPAAMNVISTVDLAVLSCTQQRSVAEQFVQFVASEQGRAVFTKHHYTVALPD